MEEAFNQIIGTGVVGAFLVIVIFYHIRTVKELKQEMKDKSIAHAQQMKEKDLKIEELHEKNHNLAIKNVSAFRDFIDELKEIRKP